MDPHRHLDTGQRTGTAHTHLETQDEDMRWANGTVLSFPYPSSASASVWKPLT